MRNALAIMLREFFYVLTQCREAGEGTKYEHLCILEANMQIITLLSAVFHALLHRIRRMHLLNKNLRINFMGVAEERAKEYSVLAEPCSRPHLGSLSLSFGGPFVANQMQSISTFI